LDYLKHFREADFWKPTPQNNKFYWIMEESAEKNAMDEIRESLTLIARKVGDIITRQDALERGFQRVNASAQTPDRREMSSEGPRRGRMSPQGRQETYRPAAYEDEGFSDYLESQRVPRASEVFADPRKYRQGPAVPDRRRSSIFTFLEDEVNDPQHGNYRGNFAPAPAQVLYIDHPVMDKSEACVLHRVSMHDLIHFQKAFVKAQSTSERPLTYITYIRDHIQTQMVAHARLHGMRGMNGLILRGRQAITNAEMLSILASMAVPETQQLMRNELKKKLFPQDPTQREGTLSQQSFPEFYARALEYRELFLHQYDLLRMVPRIAPIVPGLHRRNGHLGMVDYFLEGFPYGMGKKIFLDFPPAQPRESFRTLEDFLDTFYMVLEQKHLEFKANRSFAQFLATDSDGYLPDNWDYDPKLKKKSDSDALKSVHALSSFSYGPEDYDYEIEFGGPVVHDGKRKEMDIATDNEEHKDESRPDAPDPLNALGASKERLGCYSMVRSGVCDRKDKEKCGYSHEEGLLKDTWKKLVGDLVESSPYKDLAWLGSKLSEDPGKRAPASKEIKQSPHHRGSPPSKKAE